MLALRSLAMTTNRRKLCGWGYEGQGLTATEAAAFRAQTEERFGTPLEPRATPTPDKPREPLSASTVEGITAALTGALLTACGFASIAALNALRDDIGELRAETKTEIETPRAETREQSAGVHATLRDHSNRVVCGEAAHPTALLSKALPGFKQPAQEYTSRRTPLAASRVRFNGDVRHTWH